MPCLSLIHFICEEDDEDFMGDKAIVRFERSPDPVFPGSGVFISFVQGAVTLLWRKLLVHIRGQGVFLAGLQHVNTLILKRLITTI